jgi:hypothetical protein
MEFLLLIIIAGFATMGLVKAARHRRASGQRAFHTTGRPQEADSDSPYYGDSDSGGHRGGGSHHHDSSGHSSDHSSSDGGSSDGGGGGD